MTLQELIDRLIRAHYELGPDAEVYIQTGNQPKCIRRIEVGQEADEDNGDVIIYPT